MESVASERYSETAVAEPAWVRALVWIGFPLLGAGTGWLEGGVPPDQVLSHHGAQRIVVFGFQMMVAVA